MEFYIFSAILYIVFPLFLLGIFDSSKRVKPTAELKPLETIANKTKSNVEFEDSWLDDLPEFENAQTESDEMQSVLDTLHANQKRIDNLADKIIKQDSVKRKSRNCQQSPQSPRPQSVGSAAIDYHAMTVRELRELCKGDKRFTGYSSIAKRGKSKLASWMSNRA